MLCGALEVFRAGFSPEGVGVDFGEEDWAGILLTTSIVPSS